MEGRKHFKKYFLINQEEYSRYKKKTGEKENPLPDLSVSPELIQAEKERKKMRDNLLNPSLSTEDKLLYHGQLSRKFLQDLNELRKPQNEMMNQLREFVQLAERMNNKKEDHNDSVTEVSPLHSKGEQKTEIKKEKKIEDKSSPSKRRRLKAKSKVEESSEDSLTLLPSPVGVTTRKTASQKKKKADLHDSPLIGEWRR